jgi:HK97 family phage major capsid protein
MSVELAIPDSPDAMQEFLLDKSKRDQVFATGADPKILTEFLNKYAKLTNKADPSISENVQEQIDRTMANFAKEHLVDFRKDGGRKATAADVRVQRQSATRHGKLTAGAKIDGAFEDIMDYLRVIDHKSDPRDPDIAGKRKKIEDAMSSTDPASGGFLVPEEYRSEIMVGALEASVVRPRARVIPMQTSRIAFPMVDSTTNNGSVYGGVIGYWTEEAAALVQSQPSFSRIILEAKKLTAYTEVPNELRRDSAPSVEVLINDIFPQAIAWFEDIAFLTGTGVGEPLGIFHAANTATISQAKVGGQAADTILWDNIVGMYSRMLPSSLASAVWVASPDTFPQLMTTALEIGTGGTAVGLAMGSNGRPQLSLLGAPIIVSEKVSKLGDAGDLNFVDFGQYLIGDRMQMEAETSADYRFGNDMTAYRFIERVDGRPWVQSAITPKNGGPTLSPFVSLAERA